jgi:hypothetical protein
MTQYCVISTINSYITPNVSRDTCMLTYNSYFYTLIPTYLLRKLRQASVLYHMIYTHYMYESILVIFNDCCIHVLELPHDGPYVTETCSVIKIYFCCVDGWSNNFLQFLKYLC